MKRARHEIMRKTRIYLFLPLILSHVPHPHVAKTEVVDFINCRGCWWFFWTPWPSICQPTQSFFCCCAAYSDDEIKRWERGFPPGCSACGTTQRCYVARGVCIRQITNGSKARPTLEGALLPRAHAMRARKPFSSRMRPPRSSCGNAICSYCSSSRRPRCSSPATINPVSS